MPDEPNIDIEPTDEEIAEDLSRTEDDVPPLPDDLDAPPADPELDSEVPSEQQTEEPEPAQAESTEQQHDPDITEKQEQEIPLSYDPSDSRFFDRSQYRYYMETYEVPAEDLDDIDLYSPVQFRPYFDEATGRDLVEQLDTHGNVIEHPVVRMRPIYETDKEIYHKLAPNEDPVQMYNTYDGRLHMVRDINEFAQAVALHEQWVNTRNTDHPEGHQLQLAPDFRWDILQQQNLQKNKETGKFEDKTIENTRRIKASQIYLTDEKLAEIQKQVTEQLDQEAQEHALKLRRARYIKNRDERKESPYEIAKTIELTDDILQEMKESNEKGYKEDLATKAPQNKIDKAVKEKLDQYLDEATEQTELNLSYADIPNQENLNKYDLSNINFSHANLSGSTLSQCYLDDTDFEDAKLEETVFRKCDLNNVNFRNAYLQNAAFLKSNVNKANFRDAKLKDTSFAKTKITDPHNWKQEWNRYQDGADRNEFTQRTDEIVRTDPETEEPLKALSQNEFDTLIYESKKQGIPPDLSHYNLSNIDFSNARQFLRNDFSGINFTGSNLDGCDLSGCTLSHCNFTNCHAEGCNFSHTLCTQTNFDHLNAQQGSFDCANMTGCTFTLADLQESTFNRTALSGVKFTGTNLTDSLFQNTIGQNNEFTPYQEPASQNKDAQNKPPVRTNLSDVQFRQTTLRDTKMDSAIVADATFFRTKLTGDRSIITNTPMQDILYQSNLPLSWKTKDKDPFFNYIQNRSFPEYDVTGTPSDRSPEDLAQEQDQLIHPETPDETGERVDLNEPIHTDSPKPDQNGDIPISRPSRAHVSEKDQVTDMSFQPEADGISKITEDPEKQPDTTESTQKEHPISLFAVNDLNQASAFRITTTFPPLASIKTPIKDPQQEVSNRPVSTPMFVVSCNDEKQPFQTTGLAKLATMTAKKDAPAIKKEKKEEVHKSPEPAEPTNNSSEQPKTETKTEVKTGSEAEPEAEPKTLSKGQLAKKRLLQEYDKACSSAQQELDDIQAQIKQARAESCPERAPSDKSKSHKPLHH